MCSAMAADLAEKRRARNASVIRSKTVGMTSPMTTYESGRQSDPNGVVGTERRKLARYTKHTKHMVVIRATLGQNGEIKAS